ncbi:MAG: CPBP family intramembrane metalloprotease [Bacteroidales bacterium]|nr:CPBP family intramembrane metalloprotease [Bacteroidales bacterium]
MINKNEILRKPAIKYAWLRVLLFIIGFLIAATLIQTIGIMILMVVKTDFKIEDFKSFMSDTENFNYILLLKFLGLLAVLFTVWIFRKFIDRRTVMSLGFSLKNKSKDIIAGFGLGFVLITLGFLILYISGYLKVVNIVFNSKTIFGTFLFFVFVAIHEEILFRGYILNNLMTSMNKYVALAISAVLFALIHGINPNITIVAVVNLILAGFVLGVSYIHTKNLWLPIFFHLSWNYFLGPIYGFEVSGLVFNTTIVQEVVGSDVISGGKFGFEGSLILTALLIIGFFAIDKFYKTGSLKTTYI